MLITIFLLYLASAIFNLIYILTNPAYGPWDRHYIELFTAVVFCPVFNWLASIYFIFYNESK